MNGINFKSVTQNTSLRGVVTPYTQTYHKQDSGGFDLLEIVNSDMKDRFKKDTFPKIFTTSDGTIFINPVKNVKTTMENYFVKWIVLDTEYNPVRNHDYPVVPLPKKGYLMKVNIPITSDNPSEFVVEYVMDYHNIQIETINSIAHSTLSGNDIDVEKTESLYVQPYEPTKHVEVLKLITDNEFFSKYLKDAISE